MTISQTESFLLMTSFGILSVYFVILKVHFGGILNQFFDLIVLGQNGIKLFQAYFRSHGIGTQ